MTQRSVGSVTLQFGLINIPVKMYLSARSDTVSFRQMTPNNNLAKQLLIDSVTEEIVSRNDIRKGYEYEKNKFVIFSKEEVEALSSENYNTASIEEFAPINTVNMLEVEKSYYIAPDKGADKAYAILAASLKKKKAIAVAKLYSRGREHLIVIAPNSGDLIMHQMFYSTEMRSFENKCAKVSIARQELSLAAKMIEQNMVESYGDADKNPTLYRDNYIDRVNKAVETKLSGGSVECVKAPGSKGSNDLVELLKASVEHPAQKKKKVS